MKSAERRSRPRRRTGTSSWTWSRTTPGSSSALLLKKNGYVLEQVFSPLVVHTTPEHDELKAIAQCCVTRHHSHHYFGFAETQWKLFEKEQPRA